MNIHKKQKRILNYLAKSRVITTSELAGFLKISWNTAEKYLLELAVKNKVLKLEKKGVNLWLLK